MRVWIQTHMREKSYRLDLSSALSAHMSVLWSKREDRGSGQDDKRRSVREGGEKKRSNVRLAAQRITLPSMTAVEDHMTQDITCNRRSRERESNRRQSQPGIKEHVGVKQHQTSKSVVWILSEYWPGFYVDCFDLICFALMCCFA